MDAESFLKQQLELDPKQDTKDVSITFKRVVELLDQYYSAKGGGVYTINDHLKNHGRACNCQLRVGTCICP